MSDQAQGQSELSTRERIGALLGTPQEQTPADPPEPSGADPVETEQPQQQAEPESEVPETDPTEGWQEIEVEGEKLLVPPKFAKGFMQERDYTQKRQADAEYRKAIEAREQGVVLRERALQALQPLYVQGQQVEAQIQAMNRLDWEALRQSDPLEYTTKRGDYSLLVQQRQMLAQNIERGLQHLGAQQQHLLAKAVNDATPVIKRSVPDWGTNEAGQRFMKYGQGIGMTPQEMMGVAATPWAVVALEKARKYDELQAGTAQLPKKIANASSPVAKPGAKPTALAAGEASYRKNQEAFRKSGGKDKDALKALIKAKLRG